MVASEQSISLGAGAVRVPYPQPQDATVSRRMRVTGRRDTRPELALRKELHALGYRYRVDLPVKAGDRRARIDVAFTRRRLAIFVDGCFWHGCPEHGTSPRTNQSYWGPKLARNRARDLSTTAALEESGWSVLRLWEHQAPALAAAQVTLALEGRP